LSVLFFGLAPALHTSKINLVSSLKSTEEAIGSGTRRSWGRNSLVITQIAISAVILLITTMLYDGFAAQLSGNTSFRTEHLLMMTFDPRLVRYDANQTNEFYRRLADQSKSVPGVKSISLASTMPFSVNQRSFWLNISKEGERRTKNEEKVQVLFDDVDAQFFETMGVRILRGRSLSDSDKADAPPVTVVNEVLAQKYWPNEDPIGKRIQIDFAEGPKLVQVVGVAQTRKYTWLTEAPTTYLYLSVAQDFRFQRVLFVESYGDAASLTGPIRDVVHQLESNMPVYEVHTMEEFYREWVVASANNTLFIIGSMGVTGLVLATVGLYGLVAYSVRRRNREFGIRMAIGASKSSVLMMVLRQGALLCLTGIAAGFIVSVPTRRLVQAVIFGAASDVIPYFVVPVVLMLVTLVAVLGPARHASTIDPMKALRDE